MLTWTTFNIIILVIKSVSFYQQDTFFVNFIESYQLTVDAYKQTYLFSELNTGDYYMSPS